MALMEGRRARRLSLNLFMFFNLQDICVRRKAHVPSSIGQNIREVGSPRCSEDLFRMTCPSRANFTKFRADAIFTILGFI